MHTSSYLNQSAPQHRSNNNLSIDTINSHGQQSLKYKIVFLGDQSVGKTSIINRFIFDTFDGKENPTIGIDFISKSLYYDDKAIKFQLWDTAGQERFRSLIPGYVRDCSAAIVVYDITTESSFESLARWIHDLRTERGNDVIIVVIGNKLDLADQRVISKQAAEKFAQEQETIYLEASAKSGHNVNHLFQVIAGLLPGNENLRIITEQNLETNNNNVSTPNIQLDKSKINEDDQQFQVTGSRRCNC